MQNGSNQINIVLNLKKNQMLTTSDFQHARCNYFYRHATYLC